MTSVNPKATAIQREILACEARLEELKSHQQVLTEQIAITEQQLGVLRAQAGGPHRDVGVMSRGREVVGGSKPPSETPPRTRTSEQTRKILNAVACLIRDNEEPTPTAAILEELDKSEIPVPGNHPQNNLAAMLSYHSSEFKAHGRQGWTYIGAAEQ